MKVFIYWNLTRGCFSVKALDTKAKGLVVVHADTILLRDVSTRVGLASSARIMAGGPKEVHAGLVGTLEAFQGDKLPAMDKAYRGLPVALWTRCDGAYRSYARKHGEQLSYNPKRGPFFSRKVAPDQWVAMSDAPMALCERVGGKAFMWAFDPCESDRPFSEN